MRRLALPLVLLPCLLPLTLAGCKQGYSPNTYAANAAQMEANVQRGTIIGVRQVLISANGTVGAASGAAAGGVAGAQAPGGPVVTALGAIGGTLVGGLSGAAATRAVADTKGWEYIVLVEPGGKLVSVTQTSKTALPVGQHVLVIADAQQARIVPDYTVQTAPAKPAPAVTEIHLSPLEPPVEALSPMQLPPAPAAEDGAAAAPTSASAAPSVAPPPAGSDAGAVAAGAPAAPDSAMPASAAAMPPPARAAAATP